MNSFKSFIIRFPLAVKRLDGNVWKTKVKKIKKYDSIYFTLIITDYLDLQLLITTEQKRRRGTHHREMTLFHLGRTLNSASCLLNSLHRWDSVKRQREGERQKNMQMKFSPPLLTYCELIFIIIFFLLHSPSTYKYCSWHMLVHAEHYLTMKKLHFLDHQITLTKIPQRHY